MITHAIVRKPGENFDKGLTTSLQGKPSHDKIMEQHDAYVRTLQQLGIKTIDLEPRPEFPDAYFVEDTAVVMPDVVVITYPGAASRQGEEASIEAVLSKYRLVAHIRPPGTLDGGDVLMADKRFFIGISGRTNMEGARQLGSIVNEYGYAWDTVDVHAGLHLKSSVNYIGKNRLIMTEAFQSLYLFAAFEKIVVDKTEAYAANTLLVNDTLIMPKGFPDTKKNLNRLGLPVIELDMSEVQKMDGGLTCLSIRF